MFTSSRVSFHHESYEYAKHYRASYPISSNESAFAFGIVHSNVWGLTHVVSLSSFKYLVTFADDFSQVTWVYLFKSKSDVFSTFVSFHKVVETKFDKWIKILRFDNGGSICLAHFLATLINWGLSIKPLA